MFTSTQQSLRENQRQQAQSAMLEELLDRAIRIESRLAQLMIYMGADPYGKNKAKE